MEELGSQVGKLRETLRKKISEEQKVDREGKPARGKNEKG